LIKYLEKEVFFVFSKQKLLYSCLFKTMLGFVLFLAFILSFFEKYQKKFFFNVHLFWYLLNLQPNLQVYIEFYAKLFRFF